MTFLNLGFPDTLAKLSSIRLTRASSQPISNGYPSHCVSRDFSHAAGIIPTACYALVLGPAAYTVFLPVHAVDPLQML